jgi:SAM-dependent methyltransferase
MVDVVAASAGFPRWRCRPHPADGEGWRHEPNRSGSRLPSDHGRPEGHLGERRFQRDGPPGRPPGRGSLRRHQAPRGQRVLDVAPGSDTTALVAARRYRDVTVIDYVTGASELARARVTAGGLTVDFRVADARQLPVPDNSGDRVLSVYGVHPTRSTAAELLRVCRAPGRIAFAAVCGRSKRSTDGTPPPGRTVTSSGSLWGADETRGPGGAQAGEVRGTVASGAAGRVVQRRLCRALGETHR